MLKETMFFIEIFGKIEVEIAKFSFCKRRVDNFNINETSGLNDITKYSVVYGR